MVKQDVRLNTESIERTREPRKKKKKQKTNHFPPAISLRAHLRIVPCTEFNLKILISLLPFVLFIVIWFPLSLCVSLLAAMTLNISAAAAAAAILFNYIQLAKERTQPQNGENK